MRTRGRANIEVLRTICDKELNTATEQLQQDRAKVLRLIEACYQHNIAKVNVRHQLIMQELQQMEKNIFIIKSRDMRLTTAELLLLDTMKTYPKLLRVFVSDVTYPQSEFVMNSISCSNDPAEDLLQSKNTIQDLTFRMEQSFVEYTIQLELESKLDLLNSSNVFDANDEKPQIETALASNKLRRGFDILQKIGLLCDKEEAKTVISAYIALARQEFDAHQIPQSVLNWQSALSLQTLHFPHSKETADAQFELGNIYLWYLTQYHEAEVAFQNSLTIENSINPDSDASCKVLSSLGLAQYRLGKYREAEETLTGCLGKAVNSETSAMAMCFLGKLYQGIGKSDQSEFTLLKAHQLSVNIPKVHAFAAHYLGDLWSDNRLREAEDKYLEALSFFRTQPDIHLANSLSNFGSLLDDCNRICEAEHTYQEALEIYGSYPNSINTANCWNNFGSLLQATNRLSEAERSYRKALEIYSSFSRRIDAADCSLHLGEILSQCNADEAHKQFTSAREIYEENGSDVAKISACHQKLKALKKP